MPIHTRYVFSVEVADFFLNLISSTGKLRILTESKDQFT
jgi:hypothetical protein